MITFTEQYKNIGGFVNILKVVERERTQRVKDELVDNVKGSEGRLMGMQGKVDCHNDGRAEKEVHRCHLVNLLFVIMRMGGGH